MRYRVTWQSSAESILYDTVIEAENRVDAVMSFTSLRPFTLVSRCEPETDPVHPRELDWLSVES